jgi:hypothetical protein
MYVTDRRNQTTLSVIFEDKRALDDPRSGMKKAVKYPVTCIDITSGDEGAPGSPLAKGQALKHRRRILSQHDGYSSDAIIRSAAESIKSGSMRDVSSEPPEIRPYCWHLGWGNLCNFIPRGDTKIGQMDHIPGSSADVMFNQFRCLARAYLENTFPKPKDCDQIPHATGATYVITVAPIGLTDPST